MSSPSTVVSMGYGSWGSASLVITLGFWIREALDIEGGIACDVPFRNTVLRAPARETRCDASFRATVINVSERGATS